MADAVKALNAEVAKYQALERELQKLTQTRAALMTQHSENVLVQVELKELSDDAQIFKKIGPVLVPQDREEATVNVEKRLEFITGELKKVEAAFEQTQKDAVQQRQEVVRMQTQLQSGAQR